jgi:CRP/FNR family transcriptional regulator, dissimilatory nitrate respiration regulator
MDRSSYRQVLGQLQPLGTERRFGQGEAVFLLGEPARAVYFLQEGEVHLQRHGPDGATVILHRARAGEFFAEASFGSDRYHCTAVCIRPSRVLALPAAALRERLESDPAFTVQWVSLLSAQLRRQRAAVERLQMKSAEERIRHHLLTEGQPPGEMHLECSLTHWAGMLGLTRETLYRTLARMENRGELRRSQGHISLSLPRREPGRREPV